jgi:LCP family protein required for cell wall assembly
VPALQNTENILLLGTDRRENDRSWRTDTIMLAAIDWESQRVGLLSFPRDLLIEYPWGEKRRINGVDFRGERVIDYPDGGFGLLRDVFQQNFGIRIDKAVRLHRSGFVELVDAIGGVDVTADCDLWELSPKPPGEEGYYVLHVPAGVHHFDGEDALKYATYRYVTGDWDRRRRQQVVILALREQALNLNLIPQIPHFLDILGRNFQTDINVIDLARYATFGLQLDMNNVRSKVLGRAETVKFDHPSGAYLLVSDGDKLFEAIRTIFDSPPIQEQVERPQGCPPIPGWAQDYTTPTPESGG